MASPLSLSLHTVPTFFKNDFSIDYESQINHARFLHENGIAGLVIMGSTGEAAHLTRQERASVIKAVHEALPQIVIIAGVAQNSIQDTIDEIDSVKMLVLVMLWFYHHVTLVPLLNRRIVDFSNGNDKSPLLS